MAKKIMLCPAPHIRYHIAAILAAHWIEFVAQYKQWIPDRVGIVFENVRKVLACPPSRDQARQTGRSSYPWNL